MVYSPLFLNDLRLQGIKSFHFRATCRISSFGYKVVHISFNPVWWDQSMQLVIFCHLKYISISSLLQLWCCLWWSSVFTKYAWLYIKYLYKESVSDIGISLGMKHSSCLASTSTLARVLCELFTQLKIQGNNSGMQTVVICKIPKPQF